VTYLVRYFVFVASLVAALLLQFVALPGGLAPWRPQWLTLTLAYWVLADPGLPLLMAALLLGLVCDVIWVAALGEHAVVLVLVTYLLLALRDNLLELPLWQASLVLTPIWAMTAFGLFWLDGLTHHQANGALRWTPVLSTAFSWPLLTMAADALRLRKPPSL
jgi:rod shape-determining protein MreD